MTYKGKVKNGVIVLDPPAELAEGTSVDVIANSTGDVQSANQKPHSPTLLEVFSEVIGKAETLPPDASANHDHYLYGTPRR